MSYHNHDYDDPNARRFSKRDPVVTTPDPDLDNGWVKSSRHKPQENVGVLVFIPEEDNHVTTGMWDVSKKWVLLDDYRVPKSEVTYWRPIDYQLPNDKTYKKCRVDLEEETISKTIRDLQKRVFELETQIKK